MPTPTRSQRRRGALVAFFVAVSAAFVVADHQQPPSPAPPSQAPAQFKAGTNFVRVDAYPTHDGAPVDDLTATEFKITEDGVPQKIETFEHIVVQPAGARANATNLVAVRSQSAHRRSSPTSVRHLPRHGWRGALGFFRAIKEPLIDFLTACWAPTTSSAS